MNYTGFRQSFAKHPGLSYTTLPKGINAGVHVEYIHFLRISAGSAAELETQILLADRLGYFPKNAAQRITQMLLEIVRMLDALIRSLNQRAIQPTSIPNPSTPLPLYPFIPLLLYLRGYSRMRSLPTRRVNFSRSRYSSSGMACLRVISKSSLNSATPNLVPGANLAFICFLMLSSVVR